MGRGRGVLGSSLTMLMSTVHGLFFILGLTCVTSIG
jgi:hypothetical protein